jgi:hypothetical protein
LLRHSFPLAGEPHEKFVTPLNGDLERRSAQRSANASLAAGEMERVVRPPRAIVAPEVMPGIIAIQADR